MNEANKVRAHYTIMANNSFFITGQKDSVRQFNKAISRVFDNLLLNDSVSTSHNFIPGVKTGLTNQPVNVDNKVCKSI